MPNPINPIAGQSVLNWLRDELAKSNYQSTEPDTEDWGWYMDVKGDGASYLVGASADAEDTAPTVEWTVQVHNSRSLKDRIFGSNKLHPDDALCALIERIIRADDTMEVLSVDKDG